MRNDPGNSSPRVTEGRGRENGRTDALTVKALAQLAGVLALFAAVVSAGWVALDTVRFLYTPPRGAGLHRVEIPAGATPREIGRILESRGIVRSAGIFAYASWRRGFARVLRGGEYWLDGGQNVFRVLDQIARGGRPIRRLTIPEGYTVAEIAGVVEHTLGIPRDSLLALSRDTVLVRRYALKGAPSLEGFLFPDTYFIESGATAGHVVRVLTQQFHRVFTPAMVRRAEQLGMTPLEAITLASVVEKEAAVASERAVIAQVFHKRLQMGMGLESDPTVKYAMGSGPVNLSLRDIKLDSPYNTYRYRGLPPGPICNPGKAALEAALYPADTDFLYFVANWDGTHAFSRTLGEHNAAKAVSKRRYREWKAARGTAGA